MIATLSRFALLSFHSATLRIPSCSSSVFQKVCLPLALSLTINTAFSSKLTTCATTLQSTGAGMTDIETGYLNAKDANALDQYLFSNGYTLEQLMELAGLAVAEAVFDCLPSKPTSNSADDSAPSKRRVLVRRTSRSNHLIHSYHYSFSSL
jgi:hypothetical protein